jgi:hypothetical protein
LRILLLHILIAAIFLFGIIYLQEISRADGYTAGYTSDNNIETCILRPPAIEPGLPESDYVSETGNTPDTDTTDGNYVSTDIPIEYTPELSQPVPTAGEQAPGTQLAAVNEANPDIQVEYRYVVHYVDREVIKEIPVEKPVTLRHFESLEELETWLGSDDTNEYIHLFAGDDGVCQPSDRYDCDDYAFQLQQRAADSGFLISVTIIKQFGRSHVINLACIDEDIYYIEPQSDKVWFFCKRD